GVSPCESRSSPGIELENPRRAIFWGFSFCAEKLFREQFEQSRSILIEKPIGLFNYDCPKQ
ncbi:hypothetical protein EOPP23_19200, partial [Endozoicomonas sp. OPT23]|uniref:hypothetical protein n=1 Tax=Endozoicomonas sp. OPT23 TaxID=2072845 RepID=UPI001DE66C99